MGVGGGGGWGGGELSSRRNFFRYQILRMNLFLGHSMNIFSGLIGVHEFFFHLIFPCANFFCTSPALPHKFSNGSSLNQSNLSIKLK